MSEDKKAEFDYLYKIDYADGRTRTCKEGCAVTQIPLSAYRKIIKGVIIDGLPIRQIPDLEDVLNEMDAGTRNFDCWFNLNGTMRKTPLKKQREIVNIEYFLTEEEYTRFKAMADPLAAFDEPEQTLQIKRNDGSSVEIKAERGRIWIRDSKKRGVASALDAEDFANALSRRYL